MDFSDILYYDESSPSCLRWKQSTGPRSPKDSIAGTKSKSNGYWKIKHNNKIYGAHRVVWLLMKGDLPKQIDHIDGNRSNNKIENLRVANNYQNTQNAKLRKDNTSGVKGVDWRPKQQKWRVRISSNGVKINLGFYDDLELAELVITEARNKYHKEYANHGS